MKKKRSSAALRKESPITKEKFDGYYRYIMVELLPLDMINELPNCTDLQAYKDMHVARESLDGDTHSKVYTPP